MQVFQFIIQSMERFYARQLLGITHNHPGHLRIARRFLCPGWEKVNANSIQKTAVNNEFLVPSVQDIRISYIVNSEIRICTCPMGISDAPCKHQGAVTMKYHIAILNFIPSLIPGDRMIYGYVAFGK